MKSDTFDTFSMRASFSRLAPLKLTIRAIVWIIYENQCKYLPAIDSRNILFNDEQFLNDSALGHSFVPSAYDE